MLYNYWYEVRIKKKSTHLLNRSLQCFVIVHAMLGPGLNLTFLLIKDVNSGLSNKQLKSLYKRCSIIKNIKCLFTMEPQLLLYLCYTSLDLFCEQQATAMQLLLSLCKWHVCQWKQNFKKHGCRVTILQFVKNLFMNSICQPHIQHSTYLLHSKYIS